MAANFNFEEGESKKKCLQFAQHNLPCSLVCQNWQPGHLPMSTFLKKPALYFWVILHKGLQFWHYLRALFWIQQVGRWKLSFDRKANLLRGRVFCTFKVRSFPAAKRPMTAKKVNSTNTYKVLPFKFNKIQSTKNYKFLLDCWRSKASWIAWRMSWFVQ